MAMDFVFIVPLRRRLPPRSPRIIRIHSIRFHSILSPGNRVWCITHIVLNRISLIGLLILDCFFVNLLSLMHRRVLVDILYIVGSPLLQCSLCFLHLRSLMALSFLIQVICILRMLSMRRHHLLLMVIVSIVGRGWWYCNPIIIPSTPSIMASRLTIGVTTIRIIGIPCIPSSSSTRLGVVTLTT